MVTPLEPSRSPRFAERRRTLLHSREELISKKIQMNSRQSSRAEAAALKQADGLRYVIEYTGSRLCATLGPLLEIGMSPFHEGAPRTTDIGRPTDAIARACFRSGA
jgi:hypothetical protein